MSGMTHYDEDVDYCKIRERKEVTKGYRYYMIRKIPYNCRYMSHYFIIPS